MSTKATDLVNIEECLKNNNLMDDKQFLQWLRERLINVHGEYAYCDYMWRLKYIADNTPDGTYSRSLKDKNETTL